MSEKEKSLDPRDFDIDVFALVLDERIRQDKKLGANRMLPFGEWLKILTEELGEASKADLEGEDVHRVVAELIQVCAVSVAWIAMYLRLYFVDEDVADGAKLKMLAEEAIKEELARRGLKK